MAELLKATARLTELMTDQDIAREFGNGYQAGTLDKNDQAGRLLELLRDRLRK